MERDGLPTAYPEQEIYSLLNPWASLLQVDNDRLAGIPDHSRADGHRKTTIASHIVTPPAETTLMRR